MKFLLPLILLFSLVSCSTSKVSKNEISIPTNDHVIVSNEVELADHIKVGTYTNFSPKQLEKTKLAVSKANAVINSRCFEDKLLSRKLLKTEGRSNQEVIDHIRATEHTYDLIMYYKRFGSTVGFTYPNVNWVKLNAKFHNGATACNVGSNLLHEWSHKIGYGHSKKAHKNRPYSVPYSLNWVMKECCR